MKCSIVQTWYKDLGNADVLIKIFLLFIFLTGHRAYVKGTAGFEKVVAAFGEHIIGEDSEVNRQELGKIVFGKKVLKAILFVNCCVIHLL